MKPTLLCLSWRDIKHPKAGGAEVFTHEMLAYVLVITLFICPLISTDVRTRNGLMAFVIFARVQT
ncbi:MAG: hypothetical protein HZT42_00010 [Paracoccaceae bacterium]|nr:MAG: hypothetical protein HZT42_00010 [Paracoccaceae bacterium]